MKKMISLMLCVLLCLTGTVLCARPAEAQSEPLPPWCVLECDDTILTVISPQDEEANCSFYASITNANVLKNIDRILPSDEADQTSWRYWFAAAGIEEGAVTVQVTNQRDETISQTYILELYVHHDGTIRVDRAIETDYPTDWFLYYVQAGEYSQAEQAHDRLRELKQSGFEGVVKLCGELYKVQVGAFAYYGNAEKRENELRENGFEEAAIVFELTGEIVEGEGPYPVPYWIYTVREGDTLWGLAEQFFGNGTQWSILAEENLVWGDLQIGQPLRIPR